MIYQHCINISTRGRTFHEITVDLQQAVRASSIDRGLCHVFLRHTSASLCITENADADVRRDLEHWMLRAAADGDPSYAHDTEGPDDMPAHIRNLLSGCEITIPVTQSA